MYTWTEFHARMLRMQKKWHSLVAPWWALPEDLADNALTVEFWMFCFFVVPDVHIPASQALIAGNVYSHMLSQTDTQCYQTRSFQLLQGVFSWRFLIHGPYCGSFHSVLVCSLACHLWLIMLKYLREMVAIILQQIKNTLRQKYKIFGKEWKY